MSKYKVCANSKKSEITVSACYLRQRNFWHVTVHKDDMPVDGGSLFNSIFPDFSGKKFEGEVEKLAQKLSDYGVTKKQIEEAILKAAKEQRVNPPKYLK